MYMHCKYNAIHVIHLACRRVLIGGALGPSGNADFASSDGAREMDCPIVVYIRSCVVSSAARFKYPRRLLLLLLVLPRLLVFNGCQIFEWEISRYFLRFYCPHLVLIDDRILSSFSLVFSDGASDFRIFFAGERNFLWSPLILSPKQDMWGYKLICRFSVNFEVVSRELVVSFESIIRGSFKKTVKRYLNVSTVVQSSKDTASINIIFQTNLSCTTVITASITIFEIRPTTMFFY